MVTRSSRLVCLLLALGSTAWAADPLPRAKPEAVGMSSERLAQIGTVLQAEIAKERMPGAVLAIARKGKLVHYQAYGYLDKAAGLPMPRDAIFSIASMTKPLVGAGVLQLMEEGRLQMSDPASRWFPTLAKLPVAVLKPDAAPDAPLETVAARRDMNIQDLLRHTSGLSYGNRNGSGVQRMLPPGNFPWAEPMTGAEFIERLSKAPLLHQPGTVWEYGFSTDVLGLVIEAETGQTLGAFLQQRLCKPLGMQDTGFVVPAAQAGRVAKVLAKEPGTGNPQNALDRTVPLKFECGGACAVSTAADMLRFGQMLLNRGQLGSARVLGSKTVDYMTADHLDPGIVNQVGKSDPSRAGYGFGLTMAVRTTAGGPQMLGSPGEFGWSGALGTNFWVDPKEQLVVVFMAATPGPIRWHYRRMISALVDAAIVD
ncbi:serine hydrolase domain-containing protein [Pelomonas sp. SE-A7]|uniref:serine hydrolase domain-containing protein n=1 Tax=Pelomonas sp. SE-A7 TaxID=3054953 RepID=UPI00259CA99D|nr:serine hydrolase domain-containing protein [Pelomonas sp. SE-A7]MDM4767811.1 serine hydrolase domain-containing protein [Pelomonas sp. SE-A7]